MAFKWHSRMKTIAKSKTVDPNYYIRILSSRQATAKFNHFVLQPDDFEQINPSLASGTAVLLSRDDDSSVLDALVSATAHGYMLAEGWGWQSSSSSCQQAVMLLSRLSFCVRGCASNLKCDTGSVKGLSDLERKQLLAKLSHLVAQSGKPSLCLPR